MGRLVEGIAQRRAWIGGLAFVMWMALQANAVYKAWSKDGIPSIANDLAGAAAGYVFGSGAHNSDRQKREERARLRASRLAGLR